jgi:hypothetical protein
MANSLRDRICAAFPGVVVRDGEALDPELAAEVIEVFGVPDDRMQELRALVDDLTFTQLCEHGEYVVVIPHTLSWTLEHRPDLLGPAPTA